MVEPVSAEAPGAAASAATAAPGGVENQLGVGGVQQTTPLSVQAAKLQDSQKRTEREVPEAVINFRGR